MQQVLQSLNDGKIALETIPLPQSAKGQLLIQSHQSLISAGTERMLLDFGRASMLGKVKQQPEKVKAVLNKVKSDGLLPTIDAVRGTLARQVPLGYSNVGHVLEVGDGVEGFQAGDRVVSNGKHASVVRVPKNLCAKVPDTVSDEEAVFTVLGSIALQGVRLSQPTLGESFVVIGLGVIGLLVVQFLHAHGCRVLGVDFDAEKLAMAKQFGAETVNLSEGEDPISLAEHFSRGRGVDGVIITAATQSNEPVHQAATMCRKRGRIILVGVVGLQLNRADFYEKELSFQVSCSYGPGRYDENYEQKGHDYPVGFVRWTEQRNFEAVLDMMAAGKLDVKPLISKQFPIEQAQAAYDALAEKNHLGLILVYPHDQEQALERTVRLTTEQAVATASKARVAFVGAGNYASRVLMPAFKQTNAVFDIVVSSQGLSAALNGKKQGALKASTDIEAVLGDEKVNTLVFATRHNLHAKQVLSGLEAGKHVFVEKPLCLTLEELAEIETSYQGLLDQQKAPLLMIGFNRRFSPHVQKIKSLLKPISEPKQFVMTVNAGFIPADSWVQDLKVGGGRLVGEGCHFVDLLRYLAGCNIESASISALSGLAEGAPKDENVTITLNFADGSQGTIHYFANGHKAVAKERLEVFAAGKIIQMDNFRKMKAFGFKGFAKLNLWRQDKGQTACASAFVKVIDEGLASPIPVDEIFEVSRVCIELSNQLNGK